MYVRDASIFSHAQPTSTHVGRSKDGSLPASITIARGGRAGRGGHVAMESARTKGLSGVPSRRQIRERLRSQAQ